MPAVSHDSDMSAFWSAVAQIVPVLALALVLEARRLAVRWPKTLWILRRLQSGFFYLSACVLLGDLWIALASLAIGKSSGGSGSFVFFSLIGVFAGLVILPLALLANTALIDFFTIVERLAPWSKWRALRRLIERNRTLILEMVVERFAFLEALDDDFIPSSRAIIDSAPARLAELDWMRKEMEALLKAKKGTSAQRVKMRNSLREFKGQRDDFVKLVSRSKKEHTRLHALRYELFTTSMIELDKTRSRVEFSAREVACMFKLTEMQRYEIEQRVENEARNAADSVFESPSADARALRAQGKKYRPIV